MKGKTIKAKQIKLLDIIFRDDREQLVTGLKMEGDFDAGNFEEQATIVVFTDWGDYNFFPFTEVQKRGERKLKK